MKPNFSYIIPFRYSPDRLLGLRRVIEVLNGYINSEIIIVEQDKHSKIEAFNLKARHIFLKSGMPFNKAWAYNVGLRFSLSDVVVFGDADYMIEPQKFINALNQVEKYDCVIPTNKTVYLSPQESLMNYPDIFSLNNANNKENISDGSIIFKKSVIFSLGGWLEDFIGKSYENVFQDIKVLNCLNHVVMDNHGYHVYHNPSVVYADKRNDDIFNYCKKANKEQIYKMANMTIEKIGNTNKYFNTVP